MRLFLRLLWLILTQSRRTRCELLGPVETTLRVFPNDLDIFLHVNNGVYLTYADLGRTDLMLRSGAMQAFKQRGWYPVVANASVTFKQSLTLGQKFVITTEIVGWTDKAIYVEQHFSSHGKHIARVLLDGRFLARRGGRVGIAEVLGLFDITGPSPALPQHFEQWLLSTPQRASGH